MELIDRIYLLSLLFALSISLYQYKWLDIAGKIFCYYLVYTTIAEYIAAYVARRYQNNFPVYAIYNLGEIVFMAMYFNYNIDLFKKYRIGVYIAGAGLILGACDIIFLEGIWSMDPYFLFFEGFCIIGMCLFSFVRLLLKNEPVYLIRYPHFWLIAIILINRTVTYIYWGLYDVFVIKLGNEMFILIRGVLVLNILYYCAIGIVYLLYSKKPKLI